MYISCSNELSTECKFYKKGSIEKMGKNLANEVSNFVNSRTYLKSVRMSFLGFSMGGVILRAALPLLSEFKDRMNTFITLSSPHLGFNLN